MSEYFPAREPNDLTKDQASTLRDEFRRMLVYLSNLEKCMSELDFPSNEPLRQDLAKARDSLQSLFIRSH